MIILDDVLKYLASSSVSFERYHATPLYSIFSKHTISIARAKSSAQSRSFHLLLRELTGTSNLV